MSSSPVIPNRHPLAPSALPDFTVTQGCLRLPTATALFLAFYTCPRVRTPCAPTAGSPWLPCTLHVRLDAALDPGVSPCTCQYAQWAVACERPDTLGHHQQYFRDSTPSRSASPVTIAPRLLLCLRINPPVTRRTARLSSRPVASGYLGRLSSYKSTRHRQAATRSLLYSLVRFA